MASSSTYNTPCAACKFLRRKCMPGCIFSPYFPPEEPTKFANVHKIFGASNVTKLLNELLPHQREDAVNSLAYEAEARIRDPVYGCVGAISFLQRQVDRLQRELDAANADLIRCYACSSEINAVLSAPPPAIINPPPAVSVPVAIPRQRPIELSAATTAAGAFYQTPPPPPHSIFQFPPYPLPWNDHNYTSSGNFNGGGGRGGGGGKSI